MALPAWAGSTEKPGEDDSAAGIQHIKSTVAQQPASRLDTFTDIDHYCSSSQKKALVQAHLLAACSLQLA